MTSDQLDRYIRSQKTAHVFQYFELKRPRLLVQAMWAKAIRQRIDNANTEGYNNDSFRFPSDFNPHARMIE